MKPGGGPDLPAESHSATAQLGGSPKRTLYRGSDPERATSVEDLRAMAHRRLPRFALEYLEAGAANEGALAANREAFNSWRFVPRALVDVTRRDLARPLFGKPLSFPLIVAPTGLNGIFWNRADILLARAAADANVPFVQSTMSNERLQDVAEQSSGLRHWFQLYVLESTEITNGLISCAEQAGCEALVITTDAQIFGKRSWSERERTGRSKLSWGAMVDAAFHPQWFASTILPQGMPAFKNVLPWIPKEKTGFFESAFWIRDQLDRALDWDRVARIRDRWKRPLLIKGLLNAADVDHAARIGADAVVISNHGGRQLDWSVASLDVLQDARAAAGQRLAVLVDGGVRSGGDIAKAVALGADAVLAGRAVLYGVSAAGEEGASRALTILHDEFEQTLGLLGCPSAKDLSRQLVMHETEAARPSRSQA